MEKWVSWLVLKSIPGLGNYIFKRLLDHFHSPEAALSASHKELCRIKGVSLKLASRITHPKGTKWAKQEVDQILKKNYHLVTLNDPEYPRLLKEIEDPPPLLYVKGNRQTLPPAISIVGSRSATQYGIACAKSLARQLASKGIAVVSGLARGIDTAAHFGTLNEDGITIGVLGSGLDNLYPPENRKLAEKIASKGAVISEFPLMTEPLAYHFPIRNRIISGMSMGTVVIEAAEKSGSLITARLAAEQNREVFAVPGSIHSKKSSGPHRLIKQGAKLVETADDILEEIYPGTYALMVQSKESQMSAPAPLPDQLSREEKNVFRILEPYPMHIDDIEAKCTMEPGKVAGILIKLELKGLVIQSPGKLFLLPPKGSK